MNAQPEPAPKVRWGPQGAIIGGPFIVVRECGPVKWGHNGNGIVEIAEFDDEKLSAEFRQAEKDQAYLEAHQDQWLQQYPDMYVAVYQEKLVGVAPDAEKMAEQLRAKGIRPAVAYWRLLRSKPTYLMLPG